MTDSVLVQYGELLLRAAGVTLWISWLGLLLGGLVGAVVGLARTSRWRVLRVLALLYTELFRSIPVLILMFFCYFGLPLLLGLDLSPFAAATFALTFTASSLMAEVVRAGIDSVTRGQWEAALSCGMRYWQVMWHIVGPQAVRVMLPPSVGVYIATLKESSLASIIGYVELTKTALLIRETTGQSLEVLATITLLYFVINYGISLVGGALERKFAIAHF
jgi:His/Glu/Gln/Arg/opine family amino acid ABC transporter permease subunit